MRRRFTKFTTFALVSILFSVVALYVWATTPLKADQTTVDPALTYLNSLSSDTAYTSNFYEFEEQTLHYVEAGAGDTILFLHGFPSYWFSFSKQMEYLRNDYHVIAIDGLGANLSDAPTSIDAYKLDQMSEHVISLMNELGVEDFHVVGHDWGAAFAFGIAQKHPTRIKTVTGIAAPPFNVLLQTLEGSPSVKEQFSYMETFKKANPVLIAGMGHHKQVWTGTFEPLVSAGFLNQDEGQIFRQATNNPKRINALINWYRANIPAPSEITNETYWPSKDVRISVPALLILGRNDPVFVPSFVDRTKAISDNVETLIMDDVSHRPHIEQSEQVSKTIKTLIEKNKFPQ
ncbi:MAG: alpha/beta fold hydrolase [Alphaproteobacteria bacterium]